jgi:hypothetical protein
MTPNERARRALITQPRVRWSAGAVSSNSWSAAEVGINALACDCLRFSSSLQISSGAEDGLVLLVPPLAKLARRRPSEWSRDPAFRPSCGPGCFQWAAADFRHSADRRPSISTRRGTGLAAAQCRIKAIGCCAIGAKNILSVTHIEVNVRVIIWRGEPDAREFRRSDTDL